MSLSGGNWTLKAYFHFNDFFVLNLWLTFDDKFTEMNLN